MAARETAAAQIGDLSDREILIAGAIAYWCEGTKNKPHRRSDRVVLMNSDPSLVRFFLRFLAATATAPDGLAFRVYIHENADVRSAELFWLKITGAKPEQFHSPTLKRHIAKTDRKMPAKIIMAASASRSTAAAGSTARSKAGPKRS